MVQHEAIPVSIVCSRDLDQCMNSEQCTSVLSQIFGKDFFFDLAVLTPRTWKVCYVLVNLFDSQLTDFLTLFTLFWEYNPLFPWKSCSHNKIQPFALFLRSQDWHAVGEQYPPTYLTVWVKLSIDPVAILQQFARDFDVVFKPPCMLSAVLKNLHKNSLFPQYLKESDE